MPLTFGSSRRTVCLWAVVAGAAACGADDIPAPPEGLTHALGTRSCGPADGPAVAIYLAAAPVAALEPAAPYVRIDVWEAVDRLTTQAWVLDAGSTTGIASHYSSAGAFEVATSGRIVVTAVDRDTTLVGTVDLDFPSAGRVRGGFRAVWVSSAPLCG